MIRRDALVDRLETACWCGKGTVWIPAEKVGETTASCGAQGCVPPGVADARRRATDAANDAALQALHAQRSRDPRYRELVETPCSHCFRPVFSTKRITICNDCKDGGLS